MGTATIKVFLAHGDAKRLRTAELSNWTGKAVAGPRSEFDDVLARDESSKAGIYFLTGVDPDTGKPAIYVGEAESIRDRVRSHLDKDFWNQIVFVVSKDENLTKAHIRYLEGKLITRAKNAGRASVTNGQVTSAKLPESDREDMEVFLDKIAQLLPVLGIELLVPADGAGTPATQNQELVCEIKGVRARGRRTPNGFVVLRGSQAVLRERPSTEKYPIPRQARDQLRNDGLLVEQAGALVFTRDVEFASPSAAASVIHGGHANGLIAWKNAKGTTLKEIEAA
jgi:hypothetical protein